MLICPLCNAMERRLIVPARNFSSKDPKPFPMRPSGKISIRHTRRAPCVDLPPSPPTERATTRPEISQVKTFQLIPSFRLDSFVYSGSVDGHPLPTNRRTNQERHCVGDKKGIPNSGRDHSSRRVESSRVLFFFLGGWLWGEVFVPMTRWKQSVRHRAEK